MPLILSSQVRRNAFLKGKTPDPRWAALAGGILLVGIVLACYFSSDEDSSGDSENDTGPEEASENEFAVSSNHFRNAHQKLQEIAGAPGDWVSDSQTRYGDQNAQFRELLGQVAQLNQQVDTTVQTESQQVNNDRETLENTLGELHLAIPVAESLYFSGPAGPALSYQFQAAVAHSAVSTSTDTANTMHENSEKHGEQLTALSENYRAALESVPPTSTAVPTRPEAAQAAAVRQHSS